MKYEITADEEERFRIDFANDVANVVGLSMAPARIEPELQKGDWLILAFAVWDSKDRPSIEVACQIAVSLKNAGVAVRPFETTDEFGTWAPEIVGNEIAISISESRCESGTQVSIASTADDHPMWIVLRDGKLIRASIGIRTLDEVKRFLGGLLE